MRTADAILSLSFLALCQCSLNPQPLPPDQGNDAGTTSGVNGEPTVGVDAGHKTGAGGATSSSSGSADISGDAADLGGDDRDGGPGGDATWYGSADAGPDGAVLPPPNDGAAPMHDGATTDAPVPHDAAEDAHVAHDAAEDAHVAHDAAEDAHVGHDATI